MSEYQHRERILRSAGNDEFQQYLHLHTNTWETRGMLMISPALLDHVIVDFHRESNVLKERRRMREERDTARGSGKGTVASSVSRQTGSRSSFPIRVPIQTRVLGARALGAALDALCCPTTVDQWVTLLVPGQNGPLSFREVATLVVGGNFVGSRRALVYRYQRY